MKGRFAPSPTGRMHQGNAFCALLSWLSAKSQGGTWLLRIEDLDPQRSKREWAQWIEDDLAWMGLHWDEGGLEARNADTGGLQARNSDTGASYQQSQRSDIYELYLQRLTEQGLTYPCYCTRAELQATQAPHESDGRQVYAGTCRHRTTPPPHDIKPKTRLLVPDEDILFTDGHYGPQRVNLAHHCGDFILRRGDGAWAYQLAVVVDDALMGVTEVVRGRDLLLSTPQQLYLYRLLGLNPPRFCHHPLLMNSQGQRLSKRDRSLDMEALRQRHSPGEVTGLLAHLAGLLPSPETATPEQLLTLFDWGKVPLEDRQIDS